MSVNQRNQRIGFKFDFIIIFYIKVWGILKIMSINMLMEIETRKLFDRLPKNRVGEADVRYVYELMEKGFSNSDKSGIVGRFEEAFARKYGVDYAISFNSGTATMHACLMAAGIGPGDEVIIPALTMASTAFVVLQCYAVPVFADVTPDTLTIDVEDIKRKITPFTKAIIPVSIYGLSPDMDAIMKIAKEYGLVVIEDNAQCYLGYYKDRLVGTIGHAASFSFQGSKHMTTSGEGGMVITNDEAYAAKIRKAGVLGYSAIGARPGSTCIPRDVRQDWEFKRHDGFGYNYRMPSICAALGLGQLERLDDLVAARQAIAALYDDIVASCEWLIPQLVPQGYIHSYFAYTCRLDTELVDFDFRAFRSKFIELGGDGLYGAWCPVHLEPVFKNMNFFGNAMRAPNFHELYKGKVRSYQEGDCPVLEKIQPTLFQFKTGYTSWEKALEQAEVLKRTIEAFNKQTATILQLNVKNACNC